MQELPSIENIDSLLQQNSNNPYPLYGELHVKGPVLVDAFGRVVVTSYTDARAVLRHSEASTDPRTSAWFKMRKESGEVSAEEESRYENAPFIERDPPEHTRLRRIVSKEFAPRISQIGPAVQAIVDDRLERVASDGACDVVADFAFGVSLSTLGELLVMPERDYPLAHDWSFMTTRAMDPAADIDRGELERLDARFRDYVDGWIRERAAAPGDDLLSALLRHTGTDDGLSTQEVAETVMLLLMAGHETVSSVIANGVYTLVTDEALRERVSTDPGCTPRLVEELLRVAPLVQFIYRHLAGDVTLPSGPTLEAGSSVVVLIAAANRDPEHFPNPDEIDLERDGPEHLTLGSGIHHCLGANLGRLEAHTALATFARRVREPRLVEEPAGDHPYLALGGIPALPITFDGLAA